MSENENPNKLFIIGNGFDLAHGLKTKYEDFLLWYLNKYIRNADKSFDDGIIKVNLKLTRSNEFVSIQEFKDFITKLEIFNTEKVLKYTHPFIEKLFETISQYNWVDIEQEYFKFLIFLYKHSEIKGNEFLLEEVRKLNEHFSKITTELANYLNTFNESIILENEIRDHFIKIFKSSNLKKTENNSIILNFNYTNTISLYLPTFYNENVQFNPNIINIHGDIYNKENIIFGYGDEDDPIYENLERLNENEILNKFKSFGYMQNGKYQLLNNFIESSIYDVYIMGHSCGVSDRVLLSAIFSHENCKKIQIFYHQKSANENDFFEKTQQISRHFKAGMKNKMRNRIVPFDLCKPLVSYK